MTWHFKKFFNYPTLKKTISRMMVKNLALKSQHNQTSESLQLSWIVFYLFCKVCLSSYTNNSLTAFWWCRRHKLFWNHSIWRTVDQFSFTEQEKSFARHRSEYQKAKVMQKWPISSRFSCSLQHPFMDFLIRWEPTNAYACICDVMCTLVYSLEKF